jgi:predicted lactoylglutathione lyase
MITTATKARLTSFAPQFLVDDLDRSIRFYEKLGFKFGERGKVFTRSVISTDSNCT